MYSIFYLIIIILLCLFTCLALVRAILGPKLADRIMAVNMIGTFTISIICLLSVYLNEPYILDIALIYAIISFVAIIILSKVYIGTYRKTMNINKIKNSGSFANDYEISSEEDSEDIFDLDD